MGRSRLGWFVTAAFCAGCASLAPAPAMPADDPAFAAPVLVEPPGLDEDPPEPLLLLAGDVVRLTTVSAETVVYEGLMVDEMGLLHVPLAGDVDVGGQPLTEAEQRVETALRRYDRVVRVNLVVVTPSGHQATVVGAVTTPGRVPVLPGTRVADLMAAVGGAMVMISVSQNEAIMLADLDGARLMRAGETVPVSLPRALQGDPRHNVRVRAGDHLFVPPARGNHVIVLGNVTTPQAVTFRRGIRLTEVLARAGGVSATGDRSDIRVVGGPLREPRVYLTSLRDLVDGRGTDVELVAGDIVYVTEEWTASVGEVLNRLAPVISFSSAAALGVLLAN